MEEFSKEELLAYEKEILGLYVTDHPLLGMEKILRSRVSTSIGELAEQRDGNTVVVGGIETKVSRITTRKGDMMVFVTLEGLEGSVEVIVFPSTYQRYRELIAEDRAVLVKGRVDIKEDNIKVIAQEIMGLSADERVEPALYIQLSAENFKRELVDRLKTVLGTYPGESSVYIRVKDKDKTTTFRLGSQYRVATENGLFAELKELLGPRAALFRS
jgi:DNA polymerase-3 subunit alpha